MKKLLIFDLDGTLSNSSDGILHCYKRTAEAFGRTDIPDEVLRTGLVGPFAENMKRIVGISDERLMDGVKVYVSLFAKEGFDMVKGFPGTAEALEELRSEGYRMCIATLMAEDFSEVTLEKLGIRPFFDRINSANTKYPVTKVQLVEKCLEDMGVRPEDAVMIGDSEDDLNAAEAVGAGFLGVTYGYELTKESCEERGIPSVSEPAGIPGALRRFDRGGGPRRGVQNFLGLLLSYTARIALYSMYTSALETTSTGACIESTGTPMSTVSMLWTDISDAMVPPPPTSIFPSSPICQETPSSLRMPRM
ncbi:MAG: HAD family hydrolase [Candidatus Methanomethylophilaceae archaeon]|nr:HAD family hydrolase [Candidatus Methanomethylophilaceae archaeon]